MIASTHILEINDRLQICATKEDLAILESRLIKWMFAFAISQSIVVLGGVVFFVGHAAR